MKYAVCPRCEGRGSHVNPAVDGNGLTAEDFDELGDDFREGYFSGVYDVECSECHGQRVVPQCLRDDCTQPVVEGKYVDLREDGRSIERPFSYCLEHLEDSASDELQWYRSEADTAAMYAAEQRMGA